VADKTRSAKKAAPSDESLEGFTDEEREGMRERAREWKAEARRGKRGDKGDGEREVVEKIAEMPEPDRAIAERVHAIIRASAPGLTPKTWYGMPAYANQDGNVVCFFQGGYRFKARYAMLGFTDKAKLDEGAMWPNSYAVAELTDAVEARIGDLVKRAVG